MSAKPTPGHIEALHGSLYDERGFEIASAAEPMLHRDYESMGLDHWAGHEGVAYVERGDAENEANAARLAACWNAMEVIDDPEGWMAEVRDASAEVLRWEESMRSLRNDGDGFTEQTVSLHLRDARCRLMAALSRVAR